MHAKKQRNEDEHTYISSYANGHPGNKNNAYQIYAAGMASVRSSASQAAWFPQTRAGFSREFCVIWAGRRGAEKEGLGVVSGGLLKAKQDV